MCIRLICDSCCLQRRKRVYPRNATRATMQSFLLAVAVTQAIYSGFQVFGLGDGGIVAIAHTKRRLSMISIIISTNCNLPAQICPHITKPRWLKLHFADIFIEFAHIWSVNSDFSGLTGWRFCVCCVKPVSCAVCVLCDSTLCVRHLINMRYETLCVCVLVCVCRVRVRP